MQAFRNNLVAWFRVPAIQRLWQRSAKVRAVLRLSAFCFVACSTIAFFAARSAYGDMKESALFVGRELSQFKDLLGSSHRLLLNGEAIYVASATTDQSVKHVLDRFENACMASGNGLKEEFQNLPDTLKREVAKESQDVDRDASKLGIMREESEKEGMVACLAKRPGETRGVGTRLREFVDTGDLGSVGRLRYVYARRTDTGKTHVVTSWTDGSFKIYNLAPENGKEPPGSDSANAIRPADSVRLLTAQIEGAPHAVRVYDSAARMDDVLKRYDSEMPKLGWSKLPYVAEEVPYARAYTRRGVDLMVFADQKGDRSYISVVETRAE